MKKCLLVFLLSLICTAGFPQRYEVVTSDPLIPFKRHYSYSIEKGQVNGQSRQFMAGNQTDWLVNSKAIKGNGSLFLSGRAVELTNETANILLTDFVIAPQNEDSQYAAGTGIYFPSGPTGMGYVYLGIYERGTMQLSTLVYFDLVYPGADIGNTAGTRIKYSARENAYYISGIMVDRTFVGMDINNLDCHTKGFILKVSRPYTQANVLVFDPDPLPDERLAWMCSVNDLEINTDETLIAFTGVNTKKEFNGYYQPMVGMIDMNLNLQWCNVYELTGLRYSGIDVEFGQNDKNLFALFNSEGRPFAITQLDMNGSVIQQPEEYIFDMPLCPEMGLSGLLPGTTRAHIMHYTESNGLIVTGNCYIESDTREHYQRLFRYDIANADDLSSGSLNVNPYSCDIVPLGSQRVLTSWWSPENSVYNEGNLYIVGSYNNNDINNPLYGYNYINVNGFNTADAHCFVQGSASYNMLHTKDLKKSAYMTKTSAYKLGSFVYSWVPETNPECGKSGDEKSAADIIENDMTGSIWKFVGIDEGGIHALLNAESPCKYQISVFDITGKKVFSAGYDVEGQKIVYLKFNPGNQLYLININNGSKFETLKVSGVR